MKFAAERIISSLIYRLNNDVRLSITRKDYFYIKYDIIMHTFDSVSHALPLNISEPIFSTHANLHLTDLDYESAESFLLDSNC